MKFMISTAHSNTSKVVDFYKKLKPAKSWFTTIRKQDAINTIKSQPFYKP